jgi:CRP-like cAMP-binding protein
MFDAKILTKYSFFGGFFEEQIEKIVPMMVSETYKPGDIIIAEGAPNDKILFIVEGRVSVVRKGKIIYDLAEGNTFGEMEVLDIMPSAATIKAVNNVTAMSMSNKTIREIYKTDMKIFTQLLMNLARDLSRRLRVANEIMIEGKMYDLYSASIFIHH